MTASRDRAVVVDLAYGDFRHPVTGRHLGVRGLMEAVDQPVVTFGGREVRAGEAWRRSLSELSAAGGPRSLLVGYPSAWGRRRASALADVGAGTATMVELLPRAVLIARSHSDATMQRCAVVETTHIPAIPLDPVRPRSPAWDVQILRRGARGWAIERSALLEPETSARLVEDVVDDSVEAVFVDGADDTEIAEALGVLERRVVAGRVVRVNRELVTRHGWRSGTLIGGIESESRVAISRGEPAIAPRRRSASRLLAGAAAALLLLGAALVVGLSQQHDDGPAHRVVTIGRTTVAVPSAWEESIQDTPSGSADDPSTTRTVFVAPDDGRRIVVVQTELRDDSTSASVAASLRNRIRQRGDDVVTEFSASTRYAGRDVISYREAPASGSPITWYVVVDDALQVSIGCQAGTGAEDIGRTCAQAVGSARVSSG